MDNKDNTKTMADLLRSGHTMLNLACPECNNPIFRNKNGDSFCPNCNRKVVIIDKENINLKNYSDSNLTEKEKIINLDTGGFNFKTLKNIVLEKIEWITRKLKEETQTELIERYFKILSISLKLLKRISDFDKK